MPTQHSSLDWITSVGRPVEWRVTPKSRVKNEFRIRQRLGSGGFGTTFLVTHLLDQKDYCLKVVKVAKNTSPEERSLAIREVELLSSTSSSNNVVRYYGAWVEQGAGVGKEFGLLEGGDRIDGDVSSFSSEYTSDFSGPKDTVTVCACDKCESEYSDWEIGFEKWGLLEAVLQPLNLCQDCYLRSIPVNQRAAAAGSLRERAEDEGDEFLCILMEYCEQSFMGHVHVLDGTRGAAADGLSASKVALFADCVAGLSHLHRLGVIHRDLKPSNIFVRNGVAKLGDLGLATAEGSRSKSAGVGTFLYVAPEVAAGRHFTSACDVYGLGVVLVEIFAGFSTGMERAAVLTDLRAGRLAPEYLPAELRSLALLMTSADAALRPTCDAILEELVVRRLWQRPSYEQLSAVVVNLHSEVERLTALLEMHNIEH